MKKIMFNDKYGLTEAVLQGKKTQTRRVINDCVFEDTVNSSRYKVGEVVAVAQRYNDIAAYYAKNGEFDKFKFPLSQGLTNKMFVKAELMPHHIRITNIRVERLQDISDEDCMAEGIHEALKAPNDSKVYGFVGGNNFNLNTPREAYAALIDKVSGKGTWDSNPYVFVYDFELVD